MAALSSSSSSSSPPPLTKDESKFNNIRPEGSKTDYADFGYFSEKVMNELAAKWFKGEPEKHGLLQGIWMRHPSNRINNQGNKIILNQIN